MFGLFSTVIMSTAMLANYVRRIFPRSSATASSRVNTSTATVRTSLGNLPSRVMRNCLICNGRARRASLTCPSLVLTRARLLNSIITASCKCS